MVNLSDTCYRSPRARPEKEDRTMFPHAATRPPKALLPAIITLFLTIFPFTGYALADMLSTICNNNVVSVGNMKGEVLAKCGKPLSKFAGETEDQVSVSVRAAGKDKKIRTKRIKKSKGVETWTYNIDGSYRFFIFRGGRLERIDAGGLAR